VLESMFSVLFGRLLDWLFPNRRRRSSEDSQPAGDVGQNVPLAFAEQFADTKYKLGLMQSDNAWLRKAHDEVIAKLQHGSHAAVDPSRFERAVTEVKKGHPEAAEALFRDIVMENRREAARAASNIGVLAFRHDTRKALRAYEEAVELDSNNADAWIGIGYLQRRVGNLEEAESAYGKLLNLGDSNNDDAIRAVALSHIGSVFMTRRDWDMAKDKFMSALKLNEKLGNQRGMAINYCSIGNVNLSSGDLAGAEEMYRKSLALSEELGIKGILADIYCNLGVVLQKNDDLDGAEGMYHKSLDINVELGHKEEMANVYGNLGGIFHIRGDLSRADEMHRKALRINEDLNHKEGMAVNYASLGFISEARGDLPKACRLWKKSRGIFSGLGARDRVELVDRAMQKSGCEL